MRGDNGRGRIYATSFRCEVLLPANTVHANSIRSFFFFNYFLLHISTNGPHTANYKGCENYHHLLRVKGNENNRLNLHTTVQMPPPHLFHRLPRGVKRTLTPTLSKENTPLIQPTTTTKAIHFIRFEQNSKLCFINYCKKTAWR